MFRPSTATTLHCWIVVTVAFQLAAPIRASLEAPAVRQCELQRAYKMLGYSCANMNLREVPQHLKADVGILDLSFNRIRELSPRSFQYYEDIRLLYLFENMIQTIEANTFSRMRDLEAIDLSTNGLSTIPKELFDLPMLRNLHVSHNNLHYLTYDLTLISKPIRAPLEVISLSKCKLTNIPNFGPLPSLLLLNVSQNELADLTPDSIAPLCSLKLIDLNETETPRCMCYQVQKYLRQHRVNISGTVNCDAQHALHHDALDSLTYCAETGTPLALVEHELFEQCAGLVETRELKAQSRRTWLWIVLALAAFLVVFMGILYVLHLRNVRTQRKLKLAQTNRRPSLAVRTATRAPGGGALPLDVVAGNDESLLAATTKV